MRACAPRARRRRGGEAARRAQCPAGRGTALQRVRCIFLVFGGGRFWGGACDSVVRRCLRAARWVRRWGAPETTPPESGRAPSRKVRGSAPRPPPQPAPQAPAAGPAWRRSRARARALPQAMMAPPGWVPPRPEPPAASPLRRENVAWAARRRRRRRWRSGAPSASAASGSTSAGAAAPPSAVLALFFFFAMILRQGCVGTGALCCDGHSRLSATCTEWKCARKCAASSSFSYF